MGSTPVRQAREEPWQSLSTGGRVEVAVAEGDPRVESVHAAEHMRARMVVLGARGLGRVKRVLVGSTSLAVARYAPCPVAIVRGRPRKTKRMLVAVDGSKGSRAAVLFLAVSEVERDSRVTLLHVLPPETVPGARRATRSSDDRKLGEDARRQRAEAERILRDGARGLQTLGRLLLGSVSETVLQQAGRPVIIVRE